MWNISLRIYKGLPSLKDIKNQKNLKTTPKNVMIVNLRDYKVLIK